MAEHRIVLSMIVLSERLSQIRHSTRQMATSFIKIDVVKLKSNEIHLELQNKLAGKLPSDDTKQWPQFYC